jgi:hypothetical protein
LHGAHSHTQVVTIDVETLTAHSFILSID